MLTLAILCVTLGGTALGGMLPQFNSGENTTVPIPIAMSPEQLLLSEECARNCMVESCYLEDPLDCRLFLTCTRTATAKYFGTKQICSLGTYWHQPSLTCILAKYVECKIPYCETKSAGDSYDHDDDNCKTYWQCDANGNSEPKCCLDGFRYDRVTGTCVEDRGNYCQDACPISDIEVCRDPNIDSYYYNDGNCKTYWECIVDGLKPTCCPEGQSYDRHTEECTADPSCTDQCPPNYERNQCAEPNVEAYALSDGYCGTYMKCNGTRPVMRKCCEGNKVFDDTVQMCVEPTQEQMAACVWVCPKGYIHDCPLRPVPEDPAKYYPPGNLMMLCPVGTLFDANLCGCGKPVINPVDNACNMELDMAMMDTNLIRNGSEKTTNIELIGNPEQGPTFEGSSSFKFGNYVIRVPFFKAQFAKLFISVVYMVDSSPLGRMILLSNCRISVGSTEPSMELSIVGSEIVLQLVAYNPTDDSQTRLTLPVAYSPGIWNIFTAIYDGKTVQVSNTAGGNAPITNSGVLEGEIAVASEGLDIGGCSTVDTQGSIRDAFMGSIAKVQFSKCVKQAWADKINPMIR